MGDGVNWLREFVDFEPLSFIWMDEADPDEIVFFGCLIGGGVALAFGV